MRKRFIIVGATVLGLIVSIFVAAQPAQAATGIRVSAGRLVEGNGTALTLRGINHAHTWFTSQTSSFANIKAAGANSVRVVLSGGRWQPANSASDVANVISLCKVNRLICVLENHDTTGFNEQSGAVSLDAAVNYWISVQSALTGQENYVILNIGNEPYGNGSTVTNWTNDTANAIRRLRTAGFQHTIMVDAPNWGQDWQFVMRDTAPTVLAADTTGNTIFSIHMYGVFDTAAEVTSYVSSFSSRGLALCICEFGNMHSDGDPNEDAIMSTAQSAAIGMMGWSWSGNGGGVEYLDMVIGFNPAQRSTWGTRYITGANGLSSTSREAVIYSGGTGDTTPPSTPANLAASAITATSVNLSWTGSTDNVGVTGYDILRAPGTSGGTFTTVATSTGTSFSNTGLTASTSYRYQVRARDAAGNLSAVSNTVTVTTSATGGGAGACTAAGSAQSDWGAGYVEQVNVTNGSSATVNGWTVKFTLPSGHTISGSWNATLTISGSTVTAKPMSYNSTLGAGAATSFGFQAARSSGTALPSGFGCTSP